MNIREQIVFHDSKISSIRDALIDEFRKAASGIKNSLAFARHTIPGKDPSLTRARILVVGGTNLVSAAAEKIPGKGTVFTDRSEAELPVLTDTSALYSVIEKYIKPGDSQVSLNFAYPLSPFTRDEKLDGLLLRGTKEHTFHGLTGKAVGLTMEKMIYEKKGIPVDIHTANDTVCLILAGSPLYDQASLAGGVIGTGFNFGFFLNKNELVNLESGNFSSFTPSETCLIIDNDSVNPGAQLFEKETSGAYLPLHYNLLPEQYKKDPAPALDGADLSSRAEHGDQAALALFERSASLAAAEIAAIWEFKNREKLNLIIEGSLYWKGFNYGGFVNQYLSSLGVPRSSVNIVGIKESSLAGAAAMLL